MHGATEATAEATTIPPKAPSSRVSGRVWREQRKPSRRTTMFSGLKQSWETRQQERQRQASLKARLGELKADTEEEKRRKREANQQRMKIEAEKERLERLRAVMSAKQLERRKRKELRAKARLKH